MLVETNQNLLLKTTSFSLASSIIVGPQVGIIVGIAHYIFSKYIINGYDPKWFELKHAVSDLKLSASAIPRMMISNFLFGVSVLALSPYFSPIAAMALNNQKVYSAFIRSIFIIPLFEEIMYRGVLQEKINNILDYAQLKIEPTIKKIIAIVVQAFLVTAKCFSSIERLVEFPFLFGMSCSLGYLKEITGDMWAPISFRFFLNSIICARVAILKA